MKMQPAVIVKKLFLEGTMVTVNHEIDLIRHRRSHLTMILLQNRKKKVDVIEELLKEDEEDPERSCIQVHRLSVSWDTLTMVRHPAGCDP